MKVKDHKHKLKYMCIEQGIYNKSLDILLQFLAEHLAIRDDAMDGFKKLDKMITIESNNNIIKNPYITVIEDSDRMILLFYRELGLIPVATATESNTQESNSHKSVFDELLDEL